VGVSINWKAQARFHAVAPLRAKGAAVLLAIGRLARFTILAQVIDWHAVDEIVARRRCRSEGLKAACNTGLSSPLADPGNSIAQGLFTVPWETPNILHLKSRSGPHDLALILPPVGPPAISGAVALARGCFIVEDSCCR